MEHQNLVPEETTDNTQLSTLAQFVGRVAVGNPDREKKVQEVLGRLQKSNMTPGMVSQEAQEQFPVLSNMGKPQIAQSLVSKEEKFTILDTKTGSKSKSKTKPKVLGPFEVLIKDNEIVAYGERAREELE